jgi:septum site-determining protein MinC
MMTESLSRPQISLRGRSFRALVVAPEPPLADWFAALDGQIRAAADLFEGRPVVVDLRAVAAEDRETLLIVLDGLEARELHIAGVEGAPNALLAGSRWARAAMPLNGRDVALEAPRTPSLVKPAVKPGSLLVDRPVRSGQSILHEAGDVIVVGAVASGAEVVAGGSIHVYGALRGRAIAGLRTGSQARIFCRKLEAELVGVDQLYRTADHWGPALHGRAVQVRCDRGALRLSAID